MVVVGVEGVQVDEEEIRIQAVAAEAALDTVEAEEEVKVGEGKDKFFKGVNF